MEFSIKTISQNITTIKTGCLVIGTYEEELSVAAQAIDKDHLIHKIVTSGELTGKVASLCVLRGLSHIQAEKVILVGLGKKSSQLTIATCKKIAYAVGEALSMLVSPEAIILLTTQTEAVDNLLEQLVINIQAATYRKDHLKSQPETIKTGIKTIVFDLPHQDIVKGQAILKQSIAIANALDFTKHMADLPANYCTPTYLAQTAQELAQRFKLEIEILDQPECEALQMNSFLAVAKGSEEVPKFIVLKYLHAGDNPPIVLVGKGITFDSGGISLKPGNNMDEMKYDMSGAASILGTLHAVAELQLKINLIIVIPACENLPNGRAVKPGDIITTMSGQTVEILNTDAEGRLILCDALTYAERFHPQYVIDVATLTGACVVALGNHYSGLFSPHDEKHDQLVQALFKTGEDTGDLVWRLPLGEAYDEQLQSNFADMANIGTPGAGSITAACFLARFTKNYTWAHLDIAGTAYQSGKAKGATGRPVALLTHFLIQQEKPC